MLKFVKSSVCFPKVRNELWSMITEANMILWSFVNMHGEAW